MLALCLVDLMVMEALSVAFESFRSGFFYSADLYKEIMNMVLPDEEHKRKEAEGNFLEKQSGGNLVNKFQNRLWRTNPSMVIYFGTNQSFN